MVGGARVWWDWCGDVVEWVDSLRSSLETEMIDDNRKHTTTIRVTSTQRPVHIIRWFVDANLRHPPIRPSPTSRIRPNINKSADVSDGSSLSFCRRQCINVNSCLEIISSFSFSHRQKPTNPLFSVDVPLIHCQNQYFPSSSPVHHYHFCLYYYVSHHRHHRLLLSLLSLLLHAPLLRCVTYSSTFVICEAIYTKKCFSVLFRSILEMSMRISYSIL